MKRKRFIWILGWLILVLGVGSMVGAESPVGQRHQGDFNDYVIRVLKTYPTDGTHQYYWPKSGSWAGVTQDIYYKGEKVAEGDPEGRCYCCGLTWEVFMKAVDLYHTERGMKDRGIRDWDAGQVRAFRRLWFGADGNRKTLLNAVQVYDLGPEIKRFDDARKGDFLQFWRKNGTGHSVIFDRWIYDGEGNIVGLRYWSTQKSTQGIGYVIEYTKGERGVDLEQTYIARIDPRKL